jgi:hypothetical protein
MAADRRLAKLLMRGDDSRCEFCSANHADCGEVARMVMAPDPVPNDVDALKAELIETRARLSGAQVLIERCRRLIER